MRVLGVDLGTRRIGVALGESEYRIATPRSSLQASGTLATDAQAICTLASQEKADAIVVGIAWGDEDPLSRMAKASQVLTGHLQSHGWTVYTVSEEWTSKEAEDQLILAERRAHARRKRRDGVAACVILERFFDEQEHA